jgi:hypothetical protein
MIIERFAPQGGVDLTELDRMNAAGTGSENASMDYAVSKAGNWVSTTLVPTHEFQSFVSSNIAEYNTSGCITGD